MITKITWRNYEKEFDNLLRKMVWLDDENLSKPWVYISKLKKVYKLNLNVTRSWKIKSSCFVVVLGRVWWEEKESKMLLLTQVND